MTDMTTQVPLKVSTDGTAGPYVMVPIDQLPGVKRVLDREGVRYSVDEDAISMNGGPYIVVVNLGRGGDAVAVQRLLDSQR